MHTNTRTHKFRIFWFLYYLHLLLALNNFSCKKSLNYYFYDLVMRFDFTFRLIINEAESSFLCIISHLSIRRDNTKILWNPLGQWHLYFLLHLRYPTSWLNSPQVATFWVSLSNWIVWPHYLRDDLLLNIYLLKAYCFVGLLKMNSIPWDKKRQWD